MGGGLPQAFHTVSQACPPIPSCLLNFPLPPPHPSFSPSGWFGRRCTGPGRQLHPVSSQNPYTEIRKRCGPPEGEESVRVQGSQWMTGSGERARDSDHVKASYTSRLLQLFHILPEPHPQPTWGLLPFCPVRRSFCRKDLG